MQSSSSPLVVSAVAGKKTWEKPAIVLEFSLVAKAQDPFTGSKTEEDPFLGAFTVSGP